LSDKLPSNERSSPRFQPLLPERPVREEDTNVPSVPWRYKVKQP
jgi:hypothetical protein